MLGVGLAREVLGHEELGDRARGSSSGALPGEQEEGEMGDGDRGLLREGDGSRLLAALVGR